MDKQLLSILVCPLCHGNLIYAPEHKELICRGDRLAFQIRDEIPIMLEQEARLLTLEDIEKIR